MPADRARRASSRDAARAALARSRRRDSGSSGSRTAPKRGAAWVHREQQETSAALALARAPRALHARVLERRGLGRARAARVPVGGAERASQRGGRRREVGSARSRTCALRAHRAEALVRRARRRMGRRGRGARAPPPPTCEHMQPYVVNMRRHQIDARFFACCGPTARPPTAARGCPRRTSSPELSSVRALLDHTRPTACGSPGQLGVWHSRGRVHLPSGVRRRMNRTARRLRPRGACFVKANGAPPFCREPVRDWNQC